MADVTLLAAFGGGLVSFLSPCVLPIVPGYLSMITGLELAELSEVPERRAGQRAAVLRDTLLFVGGFSAVFVLLGLGATSVGSAVADHAGTLTRISGLLVLAMALFLAGSLFLQAPWLYGERRFHPSPSRFGPLAAPITGVAFGFGWTPCIGPVLTSVLAVAATQDSAGRGALLLAVYSAGLGVPFVLTGLAFGRIAPTLAGVRRHLRTITLVSALSMALFGTLLALDRLTWVTSQLQDALAAIGLDLLVELG